MTTIYHATDDDYAQLGALLDFDTACDMLREMSRERLETIIEQAEQTRPQREFWRMMHGPLHSDMFDREDRLIVAAKAMLADPGVFEHIARLKAEIAILQERLEAFVKVG